MATKFQDYYQSLGVSREASSEEIQAAYRKLARKYHPDVNKEAGAEHRFKEIGEAYEVLKDPEKRKRYDALGANWKQGQEFRPPPGWQGAQGPGGFHTNFGGRSRRGGAGGAGEAADFSDFFESFFGGGGGFTNDEFVDAMRGGRSGARGRRNHALRGQTHEVDITIPLADAFHGAKRRIALASVDENGEETTKNYDVRIPPGVTNGSTIRLPGQGGEGAGGGPAGDLLLRVHIEADPHFRIDPDRKHDLIATLHVSPWEAALGAKVPLKTLDGEVILTLPAGSQSGQKLRIRGKGMPAKGGDRGDLYAEVKIVVPKTLTEEERKGFDELGKASQFNPRAT